MQLNQRLSNKVNSSGWSEYFSLNLHERINAKSIRNALNINYIMSATMTSVRLSKGRDFSSPAIYSRGCKQWFDRVYHK